MFKKTCFECGAKMDTLYEGRCKTCYKEEKPPIEELRPINLKYCNLCKRIHYNNQLITIEELEQRLPEIVKKHIVIDDAYTLKELKIENLKIEGQKVRFDVDIDAKLKSQ